MQERKDNLNRKISTLTFSKEQPSSKERGNEDAVLVLENDKKIVAFIVDGGTALSTITSASPEIFDGYFAANTAAEGVKIHFEERVSSESLLLDANREIKRNLKAAGIDAENTDSDLLPTCGGASLIIVNKKYGEIEISQIGDTAVIVKFRNGQTKVAITPSINHEDIEAYRLAKEISIRNKTGIKEALASSEVASTLALGRHKENIKGGYGALNGKKGAKGFVITKRFKVSEIARIIALTDGMVPPQHKFSQEPNWEALAKNIMSSKLKRFYEEYVFEPKEKDPNLTLYPRFKQHDDASLLEIVFE